MEPVETVPLWGGKHLGLDLINILTVGTTLIPTSVVILVAIFCWNTLIGPFEVALLAVSLFVTGFGVTLGYHRYFTHNSFQTSSWFKRLLGIFASINMQGPLLFWCSCHREHHKHSDREGDPHSPHLHGEGPLAAIKGFLHAHFGWIAFAGGYKYKASAVRDLYADEDVRFVDHYYLLWVFLGLALPALAGGLYHQSIEGAVMGFFWGGVVRIALSHHFTWSINSFGHLFGDKPFVTGDESRNNFFLAIISMGEGWHNNHHAFPQSARHGLHWWQFDTSYVVLRILEKLGIVWNVRLVSEEQMKKKLVVPNAPVPVAEPAQALALEKDREDALV